MSNPKRSRSSSSASVIFNNSDLLTDLILLYLPPKSLLKFQSVNKQWYSIISSLSFRRDHTLRHLSKPHDPIFLLQDQAADIPSRFFQFDPAAGNLTPFRHFPFPKATILQSCNGLLLLDCHRYEICVLKRYHVVFNPTTMKSRKLTLPRSFNGLSLVFDPSKSPYYKVYCFRKIIRKPHDTALLAVYNSETHTWSQREGTYSPTYRFHGGFYWKNNICFLRSRNTPRRFSLEDEKVQYMDYPPRGRENRKYCKVESNGHVNFVWVSSLKRKKCLCSFELSGDDFCWSKVYKFDLDTHCLDDHEKDKLSFLGMVREEKMEDSVLLFHVPGKILKYEVPTKSFEVAAVFNKEGFGDLQFGPKYAHQFIPTLADV